MRFLKRAFVFGGRSDLIGRLLFRIAKMPMVGIVVGYVFQYLPSLIPVRRVLSTPHVLAFYHPQPVWDQHIVIVPKKRIRSLMELGRTENVGYFADVLSAAGAIVQKKGLKAPSLCSNGGPRQEIHQLHFHLFANRCYVTPVPQSATISAVYVDDNVRIVPHPSPNSQLHMVVYAQDWRGAAKGLSILNDRYNLVSQGYTVFLEMQGAEPYGGISFHVVAGRWL